MKNLNLPILIITSLSSLVMGFSIAMIFNSSQKPNSNKNSKLYHDVELKTEYLDSTVDITKGKSYVKVFCDDEKDPFSKTTFDTITILDIKKSKFNSDLIYVKWTFNKWRDTSKFISSEYKYLESSIKKIK